MKRIAGIFFILLISFSGKAQQNYVTLDWANIEAGVRNNGVLFMNGNQSAFEVPKGSGIHAILSSSLWITGKDRNGVYYAAASAYDSIATDFYQGPIDKSTGQADDPSYWNYVWTADSAAIEYHKTAYNNTGYVPSWNIKNWPGNANRPGDFNAILAPFIDLDQDNLYEPDQGEVPFIDGDAAAYFILNDKYGAHNLSGSAPMGIEVYAAVYVDNKAEAANSVYVKYRIVNRSNETYDSLMVGMFTDFLLGNPFDNYMSTDSSRNFIYSYNGTPYDSNGYKANPPAMGMEFLNRKLGSSMLIDWSGGNTGWPTQTKHYFNLMTSCWKDGSKLQDPVSSQKKYHFQGNPCDGSGWTEYGSLQPPGRRRMLASAEPITLNPGEVTALDIAYVFSNRGSDNLNNVCTLLDDADESKMYWDNILSSIESPVAILPAGLYPNPANKHVSSRYVASGKYTIYGIDGRRHAHGDFIESINLQNLQDGVYLILLEDELGNRYRDKLILRK